MVTAVLLVITQILLPLFKAEPGHCLENHTGSRSGVEDTATSANMVMSNSTNVNPSTIFHDRTRPFLTNSGHCLENRTGSHLEDEDTPTSSNMVRNSSRQIQQPYFTRSCWKRRTYIHAMERLLEGKNRYPLDVFNSLVTDIQQANARFFNRRS